MTSVIIVLIIITIAVNLFPPLGELLAGLFALVVGLAFSLGLLVAFIALIKFIWGGCMNVQETAVFFSLVLQYGLAYYIATHTIYRRWAVALVVPWFVWFYV